MILSFSGLLVYCYSNYRGTSTRRTLLYCTTYVLLHYVHYDTYQIPWFSTATVLLPYVAFPIRSRRAVRNLEITAELRMMSSNGLFSFISRRIQASPSFTKKLSNPVSKESKLLHARNLTTTSQHSKLCFQNNSWFSSLRRTFSTTTNTNATIPEDIFRPPGWELLHSPPKPEERIRGALVGIVVSDKMQKTVNVAVDRYKMNTKYHKRIRYTRKFMAHDEEEVCNMGDLVSDDARIRH